MVDLEENLRLAHQSARECLKTSQKVQKKAYDVRIRKNIYKEGDLVFVLDSALKKGNSTKLHLPWKGPAVIKHSLSPYLYEIQYRDKATVINHDRLKRVTVRNEDMPPWLIRYLKTQGQKQTPVYCYCRKEDNGSFMIQCSTCLEWFHGTCVDITPRQAKSIKQYICCECTSNIT